MLTPTASNRLSRGKGMLWTLIVTMIAKLDDTFVTHNMKWGKYRSDQNTILSPHICIISFYM